MIPTLRWINHVVRHFLVSLLLAKAPFLLIPVLAAFLVLLLSYLFVPLPTMPIPVLVLQGMLVFAAFHFFVAIFFRTFAFPLPLAISLVFIFLILVVLYTLAMASTLVIVLARLILYPLFFLILVASSAQSCSCFEEARTTACSLASPIFCWFFQTVAL